MSTLSRDLGITFDSNLSLTVRYGNMFRILNILGLIRKVSKFFPNTNTLRVLYRQLIGFILEYGSIIWPSYGNSYINDIQSAILPLFSLHVLADRWETTLFYNTAPPYGYIALYTTTDTLVIGDRSAWTYNCKNWVKLTVKAFWI